MQAKNESTNNRTRSTSTTTPTAATPTSPTPASPGLEPPSEPAQKPARPAPPANAFSPAFLEVARHLERRKEAAGGAGGAGGPGGDGGFAAGARSAGPFTVEPVAAGWGTLWAVVRRGEPVAEGAGAVAVFLERTTALLAAAVLPASAEPNHVTVAERGKRLGLPVHDGRVHLGHVARREEYLPRDLHVARHLATHPDALVLLAEALDYETLVLFGRALMRRLEQAMARSMATA